MPERLLDDDASILRQVGVREAAHDGGEQRRRGLEVEDREFRALDLPRDALVGGGVVEIAGDIGELLGEALEDSLVELFARVDDRLPGAVDELLLAPVRGRYADDPAEQEAASLEPVQRLERLLLRQVAGDPEDHEHVTLTGSRHRSASLSGHCHAA